MNLIEAIEHRKSTRKYKNKKLNQRTLDEIKRKLEEPDELDTVFSSDIGGHIKDREEIEDLTKGIIGDYGKILSPHYLILSTEKEKNNLVDLGYVGEKIVLELTKKKIGTCWIGKFGNKQRIKKRIGLSTQKLPMAFIAFGEAQNTPLRNQNPSRKDLEELTVEGDIKRFNELLRIVKLAPSAINRQPWRFKIKKDRIDFFLTKKGFVKKILNRVSNIKTLDYIDIGIALRHAEIASCHYNQKMVFEDLGLRSEQNLEYIISLKKQSDEQ